MKFDITKLSEQELFEHLEKLDECEMQDLKMDGSGELGHVISEGYDKSRQKVWDEIERRGIAPVYEEAFNEIIGWGDDELPY